MNFHTPVRQILGITDPMRDTRDLLAVRTWDGIYFLSLDMCLETDKLQLISSHRFDRPPMDVALHPDLYGESLMLLDDGSLYLWDAERGQTDM